MTSSSNSPNLSSDEFDENEIPDNALKGLLQKELELQLLIDALQTEIAQLEERITGKDKGNHEELDEKGKNYIYIYIYILSVCYVFI